MEIGPTAGSGEWAVELRDVSKMFGDVVAVDAMSLGIEDGEFFSLLGPSGCGKTTTLRIIAGFEQPTIGELYIKGMPVAGVQPHRRPVNTVFQNYALFPHMNVQQNVAFGLEMKKVPRREIERRVKEVLALVQLEGMGERKPKQLSGGQQQRVALARALVNKPRVLLLDEPLGALDLKLRKAMQLELKQIQAEVGITFIYVTHDQEEALTMSNRIAVMNLGVVQQVGHPREIYEHPANRFVADFIGETNFIEAVVTEAGSRTRLSVDQLELVATSRAKEVDEGQTVTLAIRPERLNIYPGVSTTLERTWFNSEELDRLVADDWREAAGPGLQGDESCLHVLVKGCIDEAIYIGTDTLYRVVIGTNTTVFVRMQNFGAQYDRTFSPGDDVLVHWLTDNAQILTT